MIGNFFRHPVVVSFFIFVFMFLFFRFGPTLPFSVTSQQKGEPFVVSGTGKVIVTPDIAKIDLGVEDNGPTLNTVQNSVNLKSKALTDALKKLGIEDKDIKTTSYNVSPQYDYTGPTPKITGFQVSVSYEVTITNFDKVNDAIAAATASGANMVGNVNFEVNDNTKKQKTQEARVMAVGDAKDKATGLAEAAGITLGRVINISENQVYPGPQPLAVPVAGGGVMEKSLPNIQPGTTEIDVTVSLSYEVR